MKLPLPSNIWLPTKYLSDQKPIENECSWLYFLMIFLPRVTMNIIDMLAIAPYYITLFFMPGVNQNLNQSSAYSLLRSFNKLPQRRIWSHQRLAKKLMRRSQVRLRVLARSCRWRKTTPIWLWLLWQVFRIARIMRVFKLARRSVGLQSIVYTVKTSYKDLGLLFSLVFMGMLVFGSLLYYAENGEPDTGFYSIPQVWLSWKK